jgi:hypothetical protein
VRRRGVTRSDLDEIRRRVPASRIPVLVIRRIVDPQPNGTPPVIGPPTAMQEALIAAAWGAIKADRKSRRLILDGVDAHG